MGATPDNDNDNDVLRLEHCLECGYMLAGLPATGVCPECGKRYGRGVVVLYGSARGNSVSIENAKPWRAALWGIAMSAILINVVLQGRRGNWFMAGIIALMWAAAIGLPLWRRFNRRGPGLIEVHLSAHGCQQINSPGAGRRRNRTELLPWRGVGEVTLRQIGDNSYRMKIRGKSWLSGTPVNAEVDCTPAKTDALQRRIERWRAEANAAWR